MLFATSLDVPPIGYYIFGHDAIGWVDWLGILMFLGVLLVVTVHGGLRHIEPAELLHLMHNNQINLMMLDVRSEADYNRFHIPDAVHLPIEDIPGSLAALHQMPYNTAFIVMSNDETAATEAWKILTAEAVPNVYILGGGINLWLQTFGDEGFKADYPILDDVGDDRLMFAFPAALGARYAPADPSLDVFEHLTYTEKVKISGARGAKTGGCG